MTALAAAIFALLLAQPAGVRSCDSHSDCYGLAHEIASACEAAGTAARIDPWILAAIAHSETRFDRTREGWRGRGLFGLNPRGRSYREAIMLCDLMPLRCLEMQALMAAAYLAHERRRCGSDDGALRSYGSGRCAGPVRYARAVRASLARLRGAQ